MTWWSRLSMPEAGLLLTLAASPALVPPCRVRCHHSIANAAHQAVICLPLLLAMSELLILNAGYMLDNSHCWDRQGTSCLLSVKRSDYKGVRSTCLPLQRNALLHGQISGSFMRKIEALMLQTTMRRKMKKKKRRRK